MPSINRDVPGNGPFVSDPDVYDFQANSTIPKNLIHWRVPRSGAFKTTPAGLQITPSRANLTGIPFAPVELSGQRGLSFIGRRQTDTLFTYSVDLVSTPSSAGQEAGITVFLTQVNHIDLSVVYLASPNTTSGTAGQLSLRLRIETANVPIPAPEPTIIPVPTSWNTSTIRLQISTPNNATYELSAMPAENPGAAIKIGTASAQFVSGGNGTFVGSLVGAFATCNGAGEGDDCPEGGEAVFKRWRYEGLGQQVGDDLVVL